MGKTNKKVYIAGRITGYEGYKEHFAREEERLEKIGHTVLNPAILPKGLTQEEYMRICIPMLNICEIVYMLEGWETSVGATIEYQLARQANKTIHFE